MTSFVPNKIYLLLLGAFIVPSLETRAVDFTQDIEPILQVHCVHCHGPDEQESQFRLDRLANMLSGGNSGEPAIVPGKPDESFLVTLIRHGEPGMEMPPDEPLSEREIKLITQWIADGAPTPKNYGPAKAKVNLSHWAFQPVIRHPSTGIDEFVCKQLTEIGLTQSPVAERRILIRRLYLVMLGIPPTPQQVDAFVEDTSDDAWPRLVERVLASAHYGERWATYWLDLVRFGETHGYEMNRERPTAWQYRDWVIDSLNDDRPYNQFIRQQIAGDVLGVDVATAFLVAGPVDQVKGSDPKLRQAQRMNELDDMINTTGTAFLGLTTGCARCHNHKFDPISQRDYYSMQAVFAGVNHGDRTLPLSAEAKAKIDRCDQEIADLASRLKKFIPKKTAALIVLDESQAQHAYAPSGVAAKHGRTQHDLGGVHYTWWSNEPGRDIVTYLPRAQGKYRVWLSWGSGYETHSANARYVIRSSNAETTLATVNQQLRADQSKNDEVLRWSGFYDAGVHELAREDSIVLIGGSSGAAVTADAIVLEPINPSDDSVASSAAKQGSVLEPTKRPAVNAKRNVESFPPRAARFVRFTIEKTSLAEGCIDELEVFAGDRNVALATSGAKASSSGDFVHPKHKLSQINDGLYGNARSWIVKSAEGGWVQIELAEPVLIDRIVWGRDRSGTYADRMPIGYRIESAVEAGQWELLASSADRRPFVNGKTVEPEYQFANFPAAEAAQGEIWLKRLQATRAEKSELEKTAVVYAGTFSQPGPTYRLYRGEPEARREQVMPDAIEVFKSLDLASNTPERERRLAFANWIASNDNPLTPRVIVNRIWQFHFGIGIVDTPSDFGRNGTPPSHPQLLDWLASELVDHDWSLKHIHRLILNSDTWRQGDRPNSGALQVDANSRFLWRFPPRRLEAEAIRDSILAVTGVLDLENAGGPGFSPFEVEMENVRHYHAKKSYGPADWRRMIYMTKVRQEREQVFGSFDCPDASMVVAKRSRSTTPLQALNLLNSKFVMQQADLFAKRLEKDAETVPQQITRAWQLCFQRTPTDEELTDSEAFIRQEGMRQFTRAMLNANEFLFIP